jgi:hypothetical protein
MTYVYYFCNNLNNHKMKHLVKIVLCSIIALSANNRSYAQVTIGTNEEPSKGSLLQLKENGVTDGDLPNANKGFSLPRVALSNREKLYPMFGSDGAPSADYDTDGEIEAVNKEHVGLLVYNTYETPTATDPNLTFLKGIFVWTGSRWESIRATATNALSFSGVDNGISQNNIGTIQLGGALTETSTVIDVDADSQDFVINIDKSSDAAEHGFFIKGLETQLTSSSAIVADMTTGKLGLSPVVPAKLAFFQSKTQTLNQHKYNGEDIYKVINRGDVVVVPWEEEADCVTNNLLYFNDEDDTFELTENCMIEISAMVAYKGGNGAQTINIYWDQNSSKDYWPANYAYVYEPSIIIINATLQLLRVGASEWENYSAVRGIYVGSVNVYRNTLNIPPTLVVGQAGDKIRLVIQRPKGTVSPFAPLGTDHLPGNNTGDGNDCGILIPYGTSFSKSLKIIAQ